jgi:hypothetical protein
VVGKEGKREEDNAREEGRVKTGKRWKGRGKRTMQGKRWKGRVNARG